MLWRIAKPTARVDRDVAGRHSLETSNTVQCSRFAASIGAKKAQDLARVSFEVQASDSMHSLAALEESSEEARLVSVKGQLMR
jgi:hypothetical protein